jgi:hypothetical protein
MFGSNRAPILRQDSHYIQIDWIELPLGPHYLGVPLLCPKQFLSLWYIWHKPYTYLALTLELSPNRSKRDSTWPTSPRSSIRCVQNEFLNLWYVRCKLCTYLASRLALSPNGLNRASTWASLPWSNIVASKMISEPMVCLAQIVHLSCTNTNTVSKQIETRFHMTHVT